MEYRKSASGFITIFLVINLPFKINTARGSDASVETCAHVKKSALDP